MRSRLLPLALATLLAAQAGCSHYSDNHRRGLMLAGGTSIFIGSIITADGAYCDKASASGECMDSSDHQSLIDGAALALTGLAVLLGAYFVKPKPAAPPQ